MIVAPRSRLVVAAATVLSDPLEFQRGRPASNVFTADLRQRAVWRGSFLVIAGINDADDFDDGSVKAATLNPGIYYTPALYAAELARARNAVSTNWTARWIQGESNRYRFELKRTTGTGSSLIATGANAATNTLYLLAGYRAADSAVSATHVGDFAAIHGSAQLAIDLGNAHVMSGAILAGGDWSSAALITLQLGDADPADDETYCAGTSDDAILFPFTGGVARRYVLVTISDPRREDAARTGLGGLWLGSWFDTDRGGFFERIEFEGQFAHALEPHAVVTIREQGHPTIAEKRPGESFSLAWGTMPGVGPEQVPGFESLFRDLGVNGEAWIAQTTGPLDRAPRLCRLVDMPMIQPYPNGRSTVSTRWTVIA